MTLGKLESGKNHDSLLSRNIPLDWELGPQTPYEGQILLWIYPFPADK